MQVAEVVLETVAGHAPAVRVEMVGVETGGMTAHQLLAHQILVVVRGEMDTVVEVVRLVVLELL
jgi:hypothetical protein